MIAPWNETTLTNLRSNYKLEDVYNADEFGLFSQCLPGKTYHFSGEKCSSGKNNKIRLAGMVAANSLGEKFPIFITGIPYQYWNQKKSWMTSELFEEWVWKHDCMFYDKARNIALLLDNCPAHPDVSNLTNVKLVFLPTNTTSVLQPMGQGVIRSLKPQYRWRMCITALEKNQLLSKISILQAMMTLVSSWNAVPPHVIVKCVVVC